MSYEDLRCRDFVELATDYLEDALTPEQRLVVERHLAFCDPCIDYLDQMRAVVQVSGALREDQIPEHVSQSLTDAFRALRGSGSES
jgi:anti-sigma factor RsiW